METLENNDNNELSISFWLRREEAERFLRYQVRQKLRAKAEAARKLLLERLDQVEAEESATTPNGA